MLLRIEESILIFIQENMRYPAINGVMKAVTFLGNGGWFWILCGLALLAFSSTRKTGIICCISAALDGLIVNLLLKQIIMRPRPYTIFGELSYIISEPGDYSFPSGHAAISFAVATVMLIYCKKRIGIPAIILAVLISFSRLYVGVHYPSDIIGGCVAGVCIAFLSIFIYKGANAIIQKKNNNKEETSK